MLPVVPASGRPAPGRYPGGEACPHVRSAAASQRASAPCSSSSRSSRRSERRRPWPPPPRAPPRPADYFFVSGIGPTYARRRLRLRRELGPTASPPTANGNVYVTLPAGIAKFNSSGTMDLRLHGRQRLHAGRQLRPRRREHPRHHLLRRVEQQPHRHAPPRRLTGCPAPCTWVSSPEVRAEPVGDGDSGTGNGEFNFPDDVAVDSNHLYVTRQAEPPRPEVRHRLQRQHAHLGGDVGQERRRRHLRQRER